MYKRQLHDHLGNLFGRDLFIRLLADARLYLPDQALNVLKRHGTLAARFNDAVSHLGSVKQFPAFVLFDDEDRDHLDFFISGKAPFALLAFAAAAYGAILCGCLLYTSRCV